MKRKDLKNLASKSIVEIAKSMDDFQKQTVALSMQIKSKKLKNTNAVKNLKRSIAQLKTLVNNKKLNNEG